MPLGLPKILKMPKMQAGYQQKRKIIQNKIGFLVSEMPRGTHIQIKKGKYKGYKGVVDFIGASGVSVKLYEPEQKNIVLAMDWLWGAGRGSIEVIKKVERKKLATIAMCKHNRCVIAPDGHRVCYDCGIQFETGNVELESDESEFPVNACKLGEGGGVECSDDYYSDQEDTPVKVVDYGSDPDNKEYEEAEDGENEGMEAGYNEWRHGEIMEENPDGEMEYKIEGREIDRKGNVIYPGKLVGRFVPFVKPVVTPIQEFLRIITNTSEHKIKVPDNVSKDISDMQKYLISIRIDGYDENVRNAIIVARLVLHLNNINFQHLENDLIMRCNSNVNSHVLNDFYFLACVARLYGFIKPLYATPSPIKIAELQKERKEKIKSVVDLEKKLHKEKVKSKRYKEILKELSRVKAALKAHDKKVMMMYKEVMSVETMVGNFVERFKELSKLKMKILTKPKRQALALPSPKSKSQKRQSPFSLPSPFKKENLYPKKKPIYVPATFVKLPGKGQIRKIPKDTQRYYILKSKIEKQGKGAPIKLYSKEQVLDAAMKVIIGLNTNESRTYKHVEDKMWKKYGIGNVYQYKEDIYKLLEGKQLTQRKQTPKKYEEKVFSAAKKVIADLGSEPHTYSHVVEKMKKDYGIKKVLPKFKGEILLMLDEALFGSLSSRSGSRSHSQSSSIPKKTPPPSPKKTPKKKSPLPKKKSSISAKKGKVVKPKITKIIKMKAPR